MPTSYLPLAPRVAGRHNVREPLDPRSIIVPLLPGRLDVENAEMRLNVPAALDLIAGLVAAVSTVCRRGDVAAALARTDNGAVV